MLISSYFTGLDYDVYFYKFFDEYKKKDNFSK